jgi:hypothetical protein
VEHVTAPGAVQINYRGDGPWRGMTTQSLATPGMFELLENCYVSSDGMEIRPMPGFKTYIDLTTPHNQTTGAGGFDGTITDARRPAYTAAGSYRFNTPLGSITQDLAVYSDMTHIHGFEQVAGRFILFGENNFRKEPIRNSGNTAYIFITDYTFSAAGTILTFNQNYRVAGAQPFNAVDTTIGAANTRQTFRLWITGLTGPGAGFLNNIAHTVDITAGSYPAANQLRILTSIVNAGNNGTGQTGYVDWITQDFTSSPNSPSDDTESLAIWTVPPTFGTPGLPGSLPITAAFRAEVANRQRDFGDATTTIIEGGDAGCSRRRQLNLPFRLVPHVAGNRLIMVAPGYNCVFQAPAIIPINFEATVTDGITWTNNDVYDRPRCLGLPKAVMWADLVTTFVGNSANTYTAAGGGAAAGTAFGGSSAGPPDVRPRAGKYKFAVAYKDEATGETGLISETIEVTTDATTDTFEGIRLFVLHPGYLMHECLALVVNVYRSQRNGEELFFDRTVPMDAFFASIRAGAALGLISAKYGVQPSAAANEYRHYVELRLPFTSDEDLKKNVGALPVIEQMPMGAKAGRTIRGGWTVFGGALGNSGNHLDLWKSNLSLTYDKNSAANLYPFPDQVFSRFAKNTSAAPPGINSGHLQWGCGVRGIPPAYSGQEVFSRSLYPYPRETVRLNKLVNNVSSFTAPATFAQDQLREIRYQIEKSPVFPESDINQLVQDAFLKLPRAQVQVSEADNPGVTPATNTKIISHESGEDVEAIGEANGQLVVCTRGRTYIVGYSQSPIQSEPELATDQFGCCGANTMTQLDFGSAWISDRGPCAVLGGGFKWIGEQIQAFFTGAGARYLRDSTGMMRHAWSAHDPDRGLIYFGMFADRGNGTANEFSLTYLGSSRQWDSSFFDDLAKSRWPCDEILVYSYRVDSWSVWRPPLNLLVKWMTRAIDQEGKPRMFFLGSDNRVYIMDDDYSMWNPQPITATVMSASTGTVIATNGTFGTDVTARGNGTFWIAGMTVLVISQAAGANLIKRTTLTSISGSDVTVADAVTVASGDTIQIGVRASTIKTNFLSPKLYDTARNSKIGVRYVVDGPSNTTAYAKAQVLTTQDQDSEPTGVIQNLNDPEPSQDQYTYLGLKGDESTEAKVARVLDRALSRGAAQGTNSRLQLDLVGGASVRLQDLYAEAQ